PWRRHNSFVFAPASVSLRTERGCQVAGRSTDIDPTAKQDRRVCGIVRSLVATARLGRSIDGVLLLFLGLECLRIALVLLRRRATLRAGETAGALNSGSRRFRNGCRLVCLGRQGPRIILMRLCRGGTFRRFCAGGRVVAVALRRFLYFSLLLL